MSGVGKLLLILGVLGSALAAPAQPVTLFADGHWRARIVHAPEAAETTRGSAHELAALLERLTGVAPELTASESAGSGAIVVGLAADYPALAEGLPTAMRDFADYENYILKTDSGNLLILAGDPRGLDDAIWDLARRLGYRHYFPGANWEIAPRLDEIDVELDCREAPDFYQRWFWPLYPALYPPVAPAYAAWEKHNRMGGTPFDNLEVYVHIYQDNREFFDANPECLALVDGKRTGAGSKFCTANPRLQQLIVEDARRRAALHPERLSISMEPSDGLGWCECADCAAIGSHSDCAVLLANLVAEAVQPEDGRTRYVGILAYSSHAAPPEKVAVDPRVIPSVTAGLNFSGLSAEETIAGWRARGARLAGVYEYAAVAPWDRDMPDKTRFASHGYVRDQIPAYHRQGMRFFVAESAVRSGPTGLTAYLLSRYLWDVEDAARHEELIEEFLVNSFGAAAGPMRDYFTRIDRDARPLISEAYFLELYGFLKQAYELASGDEAVLRRIDDCALYVRYMELYYSYNRAAGDEQQKRFEAYCRHLYRQRDSMMVSLVAQILTLVESPAFREHFPDGDLRADWKDTTPFERSEIASWIDHAETEYRPLPFKPVNFSTNLVPAPSGLPQLPLTKIHEFNGYANQPYDVWYYQDTAQQPQEFTILHGIIPHYRSFMPEAVLRLYSSDNPFPGAAVAETLLPIDGEARSYRFASPFAGTQRLELSANDGGTMIEYPPGTRAVREASSARPMTAMAPWQGCIYLPPGTDTVGGYFNGRLTLVDQEGVQRYHQVNETGFFAVPAELRETGQAWQIIFQGDSLQLMTVPPYLARTPQELLVPQEVW